MKKMCLSLIVLLSIYSVKAQEKSVGNLKNNEIKLNALYLVLGAFEGSYEYLLNEESSIGASVFIPIDDDINEDINYYIAPYYRFFFGKKYAAGFFLEGFGMLNSVNYNSYFFNAGSEPIINEDNVTNFALGIGLGGKWVTKRGIIGELNLGFGRNLFNTSNHENNEIVAKLGIVIGYRF